MEKLFDLDLVTTAPGVPYRVHLEDGDVIEIHSPAKMPKSQDVATIEEPLRRAG